MIRQIPASLIERVVATYYAMIGLVFVLDPAALVSPIYDSWRSFGVQNWGICLLVVSALHFLGAWVNGNAPRFTLPVRVSACTLHTYVSLQFALYFYDAGAFFAVPLFGFLMPAILVLILGPVVSALKAEWKFT